MNILIDIKVLLSQECLTQHKPFVCDFIIRKVKDTIRKIFPYINYIKLQKDNLKSDSKSYINKYGDNSQEGGFVEGYWNILKGALLEATSRSCGWTKGLARHQELLWYNKGKNIVLVRRAKNVRSGCKEMQVSGSI